MTEGILLFLLTLVASGIGTATGFGTSTIMIPVLTLFVPMPIALLFVGIIHLCGDVWKVLLFKKGFDWKLVLGFGRKPALRIIRLHPNFLSWRLYR